MPPLKDRILTAIYGTALVTTSLGAGGCVVDDLPEGAQKSGTNTTQTSITNTQATSTSGTSTVLTNTTSTSGTNTTRTAVTNTSGTNTQATNTVVTNTSTTSTSGTNTSGCDAEGKPRLSYEGWRDEVGRGFDWDGEYIVCQTPEFGQECVDPASMGRADRDKAVEVWLRDSKGRECNDLPYSVGYEYADTPTGATFCGPFKQTQGESCCYVIELSFSVCAIGRPFTVDGMARLAQVAQRQGWSEAWEVEGLESLPEKLRQELALHWAESGVHEHASVASFARFLMDLMSLGAPRRLVAATTKAIDDEIRHATASFAIASAYAGVALGPGEVDMTGSMEHAGEKAQILRAAIEEGCIGETMAASMAQWQVGKVHDQGIKRVLEQIAQEEGDHALLAWEFVHWMLIEHPELQEEARKVFMESYEPKELEWPRGVSVTERIVQAHGKVRPATQDYLRRRAYHEIVLPCAQALFEALDGEVLLEQDDLRIG